MDTTRRYPRTLNEAFPSDASYACSIERGAARVSLIGPLLIASVLLVLLGTVVAVVAS